MFARMTTIMIKPEEIDRAITTFRKSVLPARVPGQAPRSLTWPPGF